MADKIVAQAKEKEFERLTDYVLNLMSEIEVGLNVNSVSRHAYASTKYVYAPTSMEIHKLHSALLELRENIVTSEEQELLDEKLYLQER